jgi:hypothetical protein
VFALHLSKVSLTKYFQSDNDDYEHTLYWGTSFALMALVFFIYMMRNYIPSNLVYSTAKVTHVLDSFIFWYQFMALVIVVTDRFKFPLFIKTLDSGRVMRLISWVTFILCITVPIMLTNVSPHVHMNTQGLVGFQIVGDYYRDIAYEIFHSGYAFFIAYLLLQIRLKYCYLYAGFIMIGISELIQLYNIVFFYYYNETLQFVEWAFAVVGIFIIFKEISRFITLSRGEARRRRGLVVERRSTDRRNWYDQFNKGV